MVAERNPKRAKSTKKKKVKLTHGEWERLIEDKQLAAVLDRERGEGFVSEKRRNLARDRRNFMRETPSAPWFDDQWERGISFPPGGDESLMQNCRKCKHKYPPQAIMSSGHCWDCGYAALTEGPVEEVRARLASIPKSSSVIDVFHIRPRGGFRGDEGEAK